MIVANRNLERAKTVAEGIPGATAVSLEDVKSGSVSGDVLLNSTSVGMGDTEGTSPVLAEAVAKVRKS